MYRKYIKRILDIIISVLTLPLFIVIYIVVAPLIILEDKGPVFYCADRLGYQGKIFKMYKFRSMKVNAPDIRNDDGTTYNSENDPRVTKIGSILRKTSIDEVPQILNILKGDMSLIGPRPDLPDQISLYSEEDKEKLKIRPGLTGYSQVEYRNSVGTDSRFKGDIYYMNNISFGMDFRIFIKTISTVFLRENIYKN